MVGTGVAANEVEAVGLKAGVMRGLGVTAGLGLLGSPLELGRGVAPAGAPALAVEARQPVDGRGGGLGIGMGERVCPVAQVVAQPDSGFFQSAGAVACER